MTTTLNARGFTLIETLVAIAILTTAVMGPFYAIETSVNSSYAARDQLTATMLAQEAVEYVRGIRDGNFLYNIQNPSAPVSWLYGVDGTNSSVNCVDGDGNTATPYNCTVDPSGTTPIALCPSTGTGTCPALTYSGSSGVYSQQTGAGYATTVFTRKMTILTVSATEVRVIVNVTFTSAHRNYSVVLDEHLYNWL